MIPASFDYHAPRSLGEAVALLSRLGSEAKLLAGGHSLLPMMKLRFAQPAHLIDLNRVADLRGIREESGTLVIGAMTTEAELIASADLIAVDALVSPDIVAQFPKSAEVVYVGKRASAHTLPQDKINQLLVDEAKKGKRVVRLKGGDPFVFGRGGEEAEELINAGVPVEIVPGI